MLAKSDQIRGRKGLWAIGAPGVRLIAICRRCGHRSYLNVKWLLGRLPPYTRMHDLERKLKCFTRGGRNCAARVDWGTDAATG